MGQYSRRKPREDDGWSRLTCGVGLEGEHIRLTLSGGGTRFHGLVRREFAHQLAAKLADAAAEADRRVSEAAAMIEGADVSARKDGGE
jgi:hypothetical protein